MSWKLRFRLAVLSTPYFSLFWNWMELVFKSFLDVLLHLCFRWGFRFYPGALMLSTFKCVQSSDRHGDKYLQGNSHFNMWALTSSSALHYLFSCWILFQIQNKFKDEKYREVYLVEFQDTLSISIRLPVLLSAPSRNTTDRARRMLTFHLTAGRL
jgi:hypothetical protein